MATFLKALPAIEAFVPDTSRERQSWRRVSNEVLSRAILLEGPFPQWRDRPLSTGDEPAPGAHLVTPRIGYIHHGIYVGDGKVVHCGAVSRFLPRGPVEEVSLLGFSRGRPVAVRGGSPAKFSASEVVVRARSRLGETQYRMLTNNCEHFCEWCLRGEHRSYQVERLMRWIPTLRVIADGIDRWQPDTKNARLFNSQRS